MDLRFVRLPLGRRRRRKRGISPCGAGAPARVPTPPERFAHTERDQAVESHLSRNAKGTGIRPQALREGTPSPLPRSFGIKDLGGISRQIFEFKGLAGKVFKNQRLKLSRSAENGFGAVSRAALEDALSIAPIRTLSSRLMNLKSMCFDHGCWWVRVARTLPSTSLRAGSVRVPTPPESLRFASTKKDEAVESRLSKGAEGGTPGTLLFVMKRVRLRDETLVS